MTRTEILKSIQGVICPVVTPFNRRGDLDEGAFRENLSRLSGIGLAGILVAGSTGEAPYLTEGERLRLVEIARDVIKAPEILCVGTGLESTRATLALSREVVERGADVLLVLTPNYYKPKMDADALVAHYRAVGAGVKRPVMIYSIPQFTGLQVEPETIARLSKLPNIVGLKESSGKFEFVRAVLKLVRPGFRVVVGAATIFNEALAEGATGAILGLANFVPAPCVGVYQAFVRKDARQARELQQRLAFLGQKINVPFGIPGIKAAVDICGYRAGAPRLPLLPVTAAARKQIAAALKETNAGLAA